VLLVNNADLVLSLLLTYSQSDCMSLIGTFRLTCQLSNGIHDPYSLNV